MSTTTYCDVSASSTGQTGVQRRQRSRKDWKVVEGSFGNNWRRRIFHAMKTNQAKNSKMTGQTAVTFPGIGSIAEARSVSRPGEARRILRSGPLTPPADLGTSFHSSGECHVLLTSANSSWYICKSNSCHVKDQNHLSYKLGPKSCP